MLPKLMHVFEDHEKNVKAEVVFDGKSYGCIFYNQGQRVSQEIYEGKSEAWAESAAENYVLGIKTLNG